MSLHDDTTEAEIGVHLMGAQEDDAYEQGMVVMRSPKTSARDRIRAYKWYIIYKSHPNIETETHKDDVEVKMNEIKQNMTPEEKAKAEKLAADWIKENR